MAELTPSWGILLQPELVHEEANNQNMKVQPALDDPSHTEAKLEAPTPAEAASERQD